MVYRAVEIANDFLALPNTSGRVTQMKLQKLTYISHGWNLVINDAPLLRTALKLGLMVQCIGICIITLNVLVSVRLIDLLHLMIRIRLLPFCRGQVICYRLTERICMKKSAPLSVMFGRDTAI